jgi:hypothetical protein
MSYLCATDIHLDDKPENSYRWDIFKRLKEHLVSDTSKIFLLGDVPDRKDRFSSVFVNRFMAELRELSGLAPVVMLQGNHDRPLKGPSFFEFINDTLENVQYITKPTAQGNLMLLPFSPNPTEDWAGIDFAKYKAVFMHQTVTGAIAENGMEMRGMKLPLIPKGVKIFSGDVHVQQQTASVVYIGSCHPVKFGDSYKSRMLVLNEKTFEIVEEIPLTPMGKTVAGISSLAELKKLKIKEGDQVRIVYSLDHAGIAEWGKTEAEIAAWAKDKGVTIHGVEAVLPIPKMSADTPIDLTPDQTLQEFSIHEQISKDLLDVGFKLLKESAG